MHVPWHKRMSRMLRGKLRARVLAQHGEGILVNSRNGLFIVDPRDFNVSRALLQHGSYDWAEIEWLGRILDQSSHIVFVGAHIGALLVPLALRSGARDIIALEPSPLNYRLLSMNLALNGLGAIRARKLAAGDSAGMVGFTQNPINSGNSRIDQAGEIQVPVERLDSVLAAVPRIDLLVMDTEGFEVQAMLGGAATLAKTRNFYVEFAPEQLLQQGSKPSDFIELVAEHYTSMYLFTERIQFFGERTYASYLKDLPGRRGLLMNLLLTNDAEPRPQLMGQGAPHRHAPARAENTSSS